MQTRELIILLLLILLAVVVIALVVRRGNAKRAEEDRAEARQMGTQAAWLESADETPAAAAGGCVERVGRRPGGGGAHDPSRAPGGP